MDETQGQEMIPRSYQTHLMRICMKQNSIIYLPTGSGKTYIAILLLKEMMRPLQKSYEEGGKIGFILVNTVPLVEQHEKTLKSHTTLNVKGISGEMNVDFWIKRDWDDKCMKYNMFVMTGKILENALKQKYIDLNRIHLMIFDECHHAVDAHTMREIMKEFEHARIPPRVLGLTATLLNKNVKAGRVMEEVTKLETSLHSKVASVDDLDVSIHSTSPREYLEIFEKHQLTDTERKASEILFDLRKLLEDCQKNENLEVEKEHFREEHVSLFESPGTFSDINRIVKDTIWHIERLGTYGGHKAIIAHHIQLQYIKLKCVNKNVLYILNIAITQFVVVKKLLENAMKDCEATDIKLLMHSSDQVLKFLHIVDKYSHSTLPLCALVFVERRFTAQILYHVLKELAFSCQSYNHIVCDYVVGFNSNPFSNTRHGLYESKINSSVIKNFRDNKLNLLVCTNLMEEGVDIPMCSLVVKFDQPNNYRSYVQSKGRTRHREGKYVIMTSNADSSRYLNNMQAFRAVEQELQLHLVSSGASLRPGPSAHDIKNMYKELELPSYYVDGPQSAHVSMNGAVALVHIYCNSLPSDKFTKHEPLWFKETNNDRRIRVILEFPTEAGHLLDTVKGDFMANQLKAKQACALEACILLHQVGELDDHLCPKEQCTIDSDTNFLFTHWPDTEEPTAGNTKTLRKYTKTIPSCMTSPLATSLDCLYIHVIHIEPIFIPDSTDLAALHFHRMFTSDLCFGFITVDQMPNVCSFPLFVSNGEIKIAIRPNVRKISLTQKRLQELYVFHHLVFNGVLEKLHGFLSMNSASSLMNLLLAPVERTSGDIKWDIVEEYKSVKPLDEQPSPEDVAKLVVTEENFTDNIVSKWYRNDSTVYLVLRVTDIYPSSPFKTTDFSSFNDYFRERYGMKISNQQQPLLLVKAISSRLNCLKPRGESAATKRKRGHFGDNVDGYKESFDEELVPEFVVKQEYPGELWIQAKVMPSVIHRLAQLIRAEELRQLIANETGMGEAAVEDIKPLTVDIHLIKNMLEPEVQQLPIMPLVEMIDVTDCSSNIDTEKKGNRRFNNAVFEKKLDSQYPWNAIDEPVDIHRNLDVVTADIMRFYKFVNYNISKRTDRLTRADRNLAIKYDKDFQHRDIAILKKSVNSRGPDLRDIYQVLASKKCNEIVNLERLETLGDSFLKLAGSLYIWLKYPQYCEGKASTLKGKLISNKNLYYCGIKRNLGSLMLVSDLELANWLPPSFGLTEYIRDQLKRREIQAGSLFHLTLSTEEQIGGMLTKESQASLITINETELKEEDAPPIDNYLGLQEVRDKTIADCVEAILGAYCESCGFEGGLRILEWLSIIPNTECLTELIQKPLPSPILVGNINISTDMTEIIDNLLPNWENIEESIGYHFKNRAYLLQALTHTTYTNNRITRSYERLEFIGDAVLDYLITMYIYEYGNNLGPGELTDLRSALVNNETFAAFTVRLDLHKSMKYMNALLQSYIGKYVEYMESVNYEVNSKMLVFINDGDVNSAENIDVPKALGDIFESVIGAIYMDSGMDMNTVWQIVYRIMYKEIDLFSACVPKNPVRLLYEKHGAHPKFSPSHKVEKCEQIVVPLEVTVNAARKMVHGYGANKKLAKKAAAKIALCLFD